MNYTALIVAAGSGSRVGLGYNKLLYTLTNGNTILEETTSIFAQDDRCKQIVIVVSPEDLETFQTMLHDDRITFVLGGKTRQESVYCGLQKVKEAMVLIHDGARPWLKKACIDRILETLCEYPACLLCVPVKDTIKEVKDGFVTQTYRRDDLRQAQTPQAFHTDLIRQCHEKALREHIIATDDAQIVELCSDVSIRAVEGSYENSKVTTMEDLNGK